MSESRFFRVVIVTWVTGIAVALSLLALDCMPHRRGLASAVQSFMQMAFGGVVAGAIVPIVAERFWAFPLGAMVLGGIAFGLWWFTARQPAPAP